MTKFDLKDKFNEHCKPLFDEALRQCEIYNIPVMYSACVKNDEESSEYISGCHGTGAADIKLHDDRINKHLLVQAGFDVIPHRNELEIQMLSPDADPDDI